MLHYGLLYPLQNILLNFVLSFIFIWAALKSWKHWNKANVIWFLVYSFNYNSLIEGDNEGAYLSVQYMLFGD